MNYQPSVNKKYNPIIEAWRSVGALMIMFGHYRGIWTTELSYWDLSGTRVDLFFVLSGYVFAPTLLHGGISYLAFMIRRFFRMYPLFILALLVYSILPDTRASIGAFVSHIFMLQTSINGSFYYAYNPAFWSLPPEWFFYCSMPVLILLLRWQKLITCLILAAILRIVLGIWVEPVTSGAFQMSFANWAVINLPGILVEFFVGTLVYQLRESGTLLKFKKVILVTFFALAILCIWLYGEFIVGQRPAPIIGNLVGMVAAFIYAIALWLTLQIDYKFNDRFTKIFLYFGALSYGIYLFHNASPRILKLILINPSPITLTVISIILTIIFAYVAHQFFEYPLRNYGHYLSQRILLFQNKSKGIVKN